MGKTLHLKCSGCSRTFTFTGNNPLKDIISYCPSCGSNDIKISKRELNYWEELSKETSVPIELLKEMFSLWDSTEYQSFQDYVKSYLQEVA